MAKVEPTETTIYYGEIYLKYIESTNKGIDEDTIKEQIGKLNLKGGVTMSILQRREDIGMEIALVAKTTGLSKVEVEELKKDTEN